MADITGLTNSQLDMFEESAPGFGSEPLFFGSVASTAVPFLLFTIRHASISYGDHSESP
jgi:hypothetical protein